MAPFLAKRGYITVALGYDIAPKGTAADYQLFVFNLYYLVFFSKINVYVGTMTTIVEQCRKGCAFVKNRFPDSR
jgi:hypothetical protein